MMIRLSEFCEVLHAPCLQPDQEVHSVVLDSRQVVPGSIFIAVRGQHIDGHDCLPEARARGAVLVVGSRSLTGDDYLQVADPQEAVTRVAQWWRSRYEGQLIAVTGSVGKTTVKEMLTAVLRVAASVACSPGNQNNEWGVPLAILNARSDVQFWVIEVGARHPGDVRSLVRWLRPDVGIVTSVGLGHAELMGGLDGVASCKYEMIQELKPGALAVLRAEDHARFAWALPWPRIVLGQDAVLSSAVLGWGYVRGDLYLSYPDVHGHRLEEHFHITLPQTGMHVLQNAVLVASVMRYYGIPVATIQSVFEAQEPVGGRGRGFMVESCWVIDDAYNANPTSMAAALAQLSYAPKPAAVWLGDMLELGADAEASHNALLPLIQKEVQLLCTQGPMMARMAEGYVGHYLRDPSLDEVLEAVRAQGIRSLLIKGSHSMGLSGQVALLRDKVGL